MMDQDLRFVPVPPDGELYEIETYPLVMRANDERPRGRQFVRACDDRTAMRDDGWVFYRYDYPYGWTSCEHLGYHIGFAFS